MITARVSQRSIAPFGLRMDKELRRALESRAFFKAVSLNTLIVSILEDHVHQSVDLHERLSRLETELKQLKQGRG